LCAGGVAVIQVYGGPVGGAAAVDVQALAEGVQGAARLDHGPLLGVGPVAGVDLDRREVGGVRAPDVQAQAVVAGDRTGAVSAAATTAAAAGRVRGHVGDAHRAARGRGTGRRAAAADAVRVTAAHCQVQDEGQ